MKTGNFILLIVSLILIHLVVGHSSVSQKFTNKKEKPKVTSRELMSNLHLYTENNLKMLFNSLKDTETALNDEKLQPKKNLMKVENDIQKRDGLKETNFDLGKENLLQKVTFTLEKFHKSLIGDISPIRKLQLSKNNEHGFILTKNQVFGFGKNNFGQLGTKDQEMKDFPTLLNFETKIIDISSNFEHTLALDKEGNVFSFGNNNFGQLGLGNLIPKNFPVKVQGLKDIQKILACKDFSIAISNVDTIFAFGLIHFGLGQSKIQTEPQTFELSTPIQDISCENIKFEQSSSLFLSNFTNLTLNETICFGINSTNQTVCSGNGLCVDNDVCQCYPNFTGDQCQYPMQEFVWVSLIGGSFSTITNWMIRENGSLVIPNRSPGSGDILDLSSIGGITINYDGPPILNSIILGSSNSNNSIFIINSMNLVIEGNTTIYTSIQLTNSTIQFSGFTNIYFGNMSFVNSSIIIDSITNFINTSSLNGTGSFIINPTIQKGAYFYDSSFINLELISNGYFIIMSGTVTLNQNCSFSVTSWITVTQNSILEILERCDIIINLSITGNGMIKLGQFSSLYLTSASQYFSSLWVTIESQMDVPIYILSGTVNLVNTDIHNTNFYVSDNSTLILSGGTIDNVNFYGNGTIYLTSFSNGGITYSGNSIIQNPFKISGYINFFGGTFSFLNQGTIKSQSLNVSSGAIIEFYQPILMVPYYQPSGIYGGGLIKIYENSSLTVLGGTIFSVSFYVDSMINLSYDDFIFQNSIIITQKGYIILNNQTSMTVESTVDISLTNNTFQGLGTFYGGSSSNVNFDGNGNVTIPFYGVSDSTFNFLNGNVNFLNSFRLQDASKMIILSTSNVLMSGNFSIGGYNPVVVSGQGNLNITSSGSLLVENSNVFDIPFYLYSTITILQGTFTVINSSKVFYTSPQSLMNIQPLAFFENSKDLNVLNPNFFVGGGTLNNDLGTVNFNSNGGVIDVIFLSNSFINFQNGIYTFNRNVQFNSNSQTNILGQVIILGTSIIILNQNSFIGNGNLDLKGPSQWTGSSSIGVSIFIENTISFSTGTVLFMNQVNVLNTANMMINLDSIIQFENSCQINSNRDIIAGLGQIIVGTQGSIIWNGPEAVVNVTIIMNSFMKTLFGNYIFKNIQMFGNSFFNVNSQSQVTISDTIQISSSPLSISGNGSFFIGNNATLNWNSGNIQISSLIFQTQSNINLIGVNEKSLISTNLLNYGTFNFLSSGNLILQSSNFTNTQIFNHFGSGIINFGTLNFAAQLSMNAYIINDGLYNIQSQGNNINLYVPFINNGIFNIEGPGITILTSTFTQNPFAYFYLKNSTLQSFVNLTIEEGNFEANGYIMTQSLTVSSNTGLIRIKKLTVDGNIHFTKPSTLIYQLNGFNDHTEMYSTRNINLEGLVYIKIGNGFLPTIGDKIGFLYFGSVDITATTHLIGVPYRTAIYESDSTSTSIVISPSIGSSDVSGYKCNYLGDRMVLEINDFIENNKVAITLITPIINGWIGFGIGDSNSSKLSILASNNQSFQIYNQTQASIQLNQIIDIGSSYVNTIFNIGPYYQSISMFLPIEALINMTAIYYQEYSNITNLNSLPNPYYQYIFQYDFQKIQDQSYGDECTNYLAPSRAETYQPASIGALLGLYLILFFICLLFSQKQPLKSRGISPYLTLLFLFAQLAIEIRNHFYITDFQGSLCVYYAYGFYPLLQICFIIIFLYFLRYFSIINLNETKNSYYTLIKGGNMVKRTPLKLKILKILVTSKFTFALMFFTIFTSLIVYTIVLVISNFKCTFTNLIIIKVLNNIEMIIVYLMTLGLWIFDIISNFKITFKQCKWIQFIIYNDPHYFRVQIFLFIPFMIYNLVIELYSLFTSFSFKDIILHFESTLILNTITYSILLLLDVIFPLSLTIFLFIQKCIIKKKKGKDSLMEIFEIPELERMFAEFAQKEFSIENVLCFKDILIFKKTKLNPIDIYHKYFNGAESIMEVNVTKSHCKIIYEKIKSNNYDEKLFNDVFNTIQTNLFDTFSRFIFTDDYIQFISAKNLKLELLEGRVLSEEK